MELTLLFAFLFLITLLLLGLSFSPSVVHLVQGEGFEPVLLGSAGLIGESMPVLVLMGQEQKALEGLLLLLGQALVPRHCLGDLF